MGTGQGPGEESSKKEGKVSTGSRASWGGHEVCSVHIGNGCLAAVALMAIDPTTGFPVGATPAPRGQGERPWMSWHAWGKHLAIVDEIARAAASPAVVRVLAQRICMLTITGPTGPAHLST